MIFKVIFFFIKLLYIIGSVIGFMLNWKLYCDVIIKYLKLSIWFFIYYIEMFYLCFNVLVLF